MTIRELCTAAYQLAVEKGWYQAPVKSVVESICLIHAELSEAVEEVRKDTPVIYQVEHATSAELGPVEWYHSPKSSKWVEGEKPEGVLIELADAVIRIADLCQSQGWDLEAAVTMKHEYNKSRSFRHGGKTL